MLTHDEWRILYQAIDKLGGFYDSKRTGIASWAPMRLEWDKLQDMLSGYYLSKETASLLNY
ncbi:hypothetical protein QTV33_001944 [Vibrio parahaemolyticus]|nr:hypothetical protein [Vibrio parahaemolyticus]